VECRTSLIFAVPQSVHATPQPSGWNEYSPRQAASLTSTLRSSYRGSTGGYERTTPPPPTSVERPEKIPLPIPNNHVLMCLIDAVQKSSIGEIDNKDGYESGDDDELVLHGMKVMRSSSGTYVVREKVGLKVCPMKSKKSRFFCRIRRREEDDANILEYGQTVQITFYETGIVTIGRGAGYILVDNSSQLVKGKVSYMDKSSSRFLAV
jgi:hypothetical protein